MRRARNKSVSELIFECPQCERPINKLNAPQRFKTCDFCRRQLSNLTLFCDECYETVHICESCYNECRYNSEQQNETSSPNTFSDIFDFLKSYKNVFLIFLVVIGSYMFFKRPSEVSHSSYSAVYETLKKKYPSQSNDTWTHVLSVLDKEFPTVKSLILLHGEDNSTTVCLIEDLILFYTGHKNFDKKKITFEYAKEKIMSHGEYLEFYHPVVKEHRILVTNLNQLPGKIARVFHSLCDEVSSDIKPSLFIFTLEYNDQMRNLKPLQKATHVLKKSWAELPDNENYPLLSRVVKNVVEIVPESRTLC